MADEVEVIDLNEADVNTLSSLPGIGPTLATRIVEFRQTVHPFEEIIELSAVSGISERMVRDLEGRVTISVPTTAPERDIVGPDELTMPAETVLAAEQDLTPESVPETERDEVRLGDLAAAEALVTATAAETTTSAPEMEPEAPETPAPMLVEPGGPESTEAEEPVVLAGLEEAAPPPLPSVDQGRQAQRRGCFVLFAGAILGALVGTALTLAILAAVNRGTLTFAEADARLRSDLQSANQAQNQLTDQFGSLESGLADMATRASEAEQRQSETEQNLEDMQQTIGRMQRDIASLEETASLLDERITEVASAAETFNAFLDRMRDLLIELQGLPPTPTLTPSATPSPTTATPTLVPPSTAATVQPTAEVTATTSGAGQPTRTPRPTATTFSLPTGTPEPQP